MPLADCRTGAELMGLIILSSVQKSNVKRLPGRTRTAFEEVLTEIRPMQAAWGSRTIPWRGPPLARPRLCPGNVDEICMFLEDMLPMLPIYQCSMKVR